MKKCASCTKDLPEAALHCVFCGAKQPPAPAVQPGLAKTSFGYSNEMMEQLKSGAPGPGYPQRGNPPSSPPMPPTQRVMSSSQPPPYGQPSYPPPPQQNMSVANAATVFIPGGGTQPPPLSPQPQPAYALPTLAVPMTPMTPMALQQPPQAPYNGSPQGMGMYAPQGAPQMYPAGPQGYAPQRVSQGRQSIEPWRDSLKVVMIVWGLLVIAALATPLKLDPIQFSWDVLIHGEGTARIPFLGFAALGVLGVVVALLPMPALARGLLAAVLGLGAFAVPLVIAGALPGWHDLIVLGSMLVLVPALLLRNEYPDSMLPRLLVTASVIAFVVPYVVPDHGEIPLVQLFKGLINASGSERIFFIVQIAQLALVVLTLLVWMPGPATAGGTVFAWLVIFVIGLQMSLVVTAIGIAFSGDFVDTVKHAPAMLMIWIVPTACLVFVGYGLATVLGKQLE